jgi:hypothetical protein
MKMPNAKVVRIYGWVMLAVGVLSSGQDVYGRIRYAFPLDMGIVIGNGAIVIVAGLALVVAGSLQNLEGRLDKLEKAVQSVRS